MDTSFTTELVFLITGISGLIILALFYFILKLQKNAKSPRNENVVVPQRSAAVRRAHNRNRVRGGTAVGQGAHDDAENVPENQEDAIIPTTDIDDSKLGAKKRAKLEAKAEKKAQREAEMKIREQRKVQREKEDAERKLREDLEKLAEQKEEAEKRKFQEEKLRKEEEEYQKLKAAFTIEEEGFDEEANVQQGNLLQEFIDYIKEKKVVMLEDIAAKFRLKIQTVVIRIEELLASGSLTGVIDDRGKFIYITMEELQAVADFVKKRGRVTIQELVENSNNLISLN